MIRVRTGSRLHFGLFSIPSEQAGPWLNQEGKPTIPRRQFGGVGLMIAQPGLDVRADIANDCKVEGPFASRAWDFVTTYQSYKGMSGGIHLRIESAAREHTGLGIGTQLGLAVLSAVNALYGNPSRPDSLARLIDRGRRSAIGVHGFEQGGFLVEGGKRLETEVSPLVARYEFPPHWRILLITPHNLQGRHGQPEIDAFANLTTLMNNDRNTDSLCRLVLLGMLPALVETDLEAFGEALYDFNRRSGAMFKTAQGGIYADSRIEHIVKSIRSLGVKGVGQSSWGPTVFALVAAEQIDVLKDRLVSERIATAEELIAAEPCNHGAVVSTEY